MCIMRLPLGGISVEGGGGGGGIDAVVKKEAFKSAMLIFVFRGGGVLNFINECFFY